MISLSLYGPRSGAGSILPGIRCCCCNMQDNNRRLELRDVRHIMNVMLMANEANQLTQIQYRVTKSINILCYLMFHFY
jgi:hypothetical protein